MYLSCNMKKRKSKKNLHIFLAFCLCCTSITGLKAAVNLEKTYKPTEGASFGYIVAMDELRDGSIIAADKKSGNLIRISDEQIIYKSLTKSSEIFKSEHLGGLGLAGEDLIAVTNTGDSRFVIVTGKSVV